MDLILTSIETGKEIAITKRSTLIGWDEHADIQLDDPTLHPYQTMITRSRPGELTIWDMHDGTGTLVNGIAALKAVLKPGDKLMIGQTTFIVKASARPRELPNRYCA